MPQLPYPQGQRLLLTMSDLTGFGTGGTTNVITVAPSVSGHGCNTKDPGPDFSFELDGTLQQCQYVALQRIFYMS